MDLGRLGIIAAVGAGLAALYAIARPRPKAAPADPPAPGEPPASVDAWGTRADIATGCKVLPHPGAEAFRAWTLATYPGGRDGGILRECSIGGASEHKEGRAWDWMVPHAQGATFAAELVADDGARARAAGVLYVIHDRKMWRAYDRRWQPYTGPNPHTDHVHVSLTREGAAGRTSFYTTGQGAPFMRHEVLA